jgi:RNA polymerase sigma-70 factor (ECF subfamily)
LLLAEADRAGDREIEVNDVLSSLVAQHERDLFIFLRGMVGQPELAADLLQDTYSDAWRAIQRSAPPFVESGTGPERRRWLFHAAYCRAVSALRHRRVITWEPLDTAQFVSDAAVADMAERLVEQETVRQALLSLSREDIASLVLTVVHGFTAQESAEVIGTSASAVAKRVSRAKQRLLAAYLALSEENYHS